MFLLFKMRELIHSALNNSSALKINIIISPFFDPKQAYQKFSFTGLILIHGALMDLLKPYTTFYTL